MFLINDIKNNGQINAFSDIRCNWFALSVTAKYSAEKKCSKAFRFKTIQEIDAIKNTIR